MALKKTIAWMLLCMIPFLLYACSGGSDSGETKGTPNSSVTPAAEPPALSSLEPTDSESPTMQAMNEGDKALVVYFSCTGNTKSMAQEIAAQTNADLFEILPEQPYTQEDLNYQNDACRANQEMNDASARPAIESRIENLSDYDTIYIGYPIWWGTLPRILNTFFDTYDLSGKTILPFCTSGGSSILESVSAIREAEPEADVREGLRVSSGSADNCGQEVADWLAKQAE